MHMKCNAILTKYPTGSMQTSLFLISTKTVLVRFSKGTSKSDSENAFYFNAQAFIGEPVCKYLGALLDSQLSFKSHVEKVFKRLSTQCGIISKLRH